MNAEPVRMRNDAFSHGLIAALIAAGVRRFVVCPGSRSTPLVAAVFHQLPERVEVVLDERGAGYFALGQIRASGSPCVVVTTSGTAVANLGPALTEAHQEGLPLLVLTANRPALAFGTDENQAVPQRGLFSPLLSFSAEVDCVCDEEQTPETLWQKAEELVSAWHDATLNCVGPAQVDIAFDKPLDPIKAAPWHSSGWATGSSPKVSSTDAEPSNLKLEALRESMSKAHRGVLLLGRVKRNEAAQSISKWANATGWLVLSDVLFGEIAGAKVLQNPNATLAVGALDAADVVVQLGGSFVSKEVQLWKLRSKPLHWWRIDDQHRVGSTVRKERIIRQSPDVVCKLKGSARNDSKWQDSILQVDASFSVNPFLDESGPANEKVEPFWMRRLLAALPKKQPFFIGNSSPIRDLDDAVPRSDLPKRVFGNRGGSGIDGLIATAAGIAQELGPTVAVLGDLTTLHDAASFHLVHELKLPLLIAVLNNGGGGIFYRLSIRKQDALFEKFFSTPHRTSLAKVADGFGLVAEQVSSVAALQQAVEKWLADPRPTLLEILTDAQQSQNYRDNVRIKYLGSSKK